MSIKPAMSITTTPDTAPRLTRSAPASWFSSHGSSPGQRSDGLRSASDLTTQLPRIETGNRIPTVRTLLRVARTAGFELVLGLRRPDPRLPPQHTLDAFALVGTLHLNEDDGFADFVIYREPSPLEGPRDA